MTKQFTVGSNRQTLKQAASLAQKWRNPELGYHAKPERTHQERTAHEPITYTVKVIIND